MSEHIYKDMYGLHFFKKLFRTQTEAAEYYGVSNTFMSRVVTGQASPTKAMLEDVGYERVVTKVVEYRPVAVGGRSGHA